MILPIIQMPDELLTKKCEPVRKVTKLLQEFGSNLLETVKSENGLGLAAPQVGALIRVIAVKVNKRHLLMYNPTIASQSLTKRAQKEECLSFNKGESYILKRPTWCKIRYLDINNKPKLIHLKDMEAVCFYHELDHLNGITMNVNGVKVQ